jgi:glycosyltransferase involved in cell wall biosynthesis
MKKRQNTKIKYEWFNVIEWNYDFNEKRENNFVILGRVTPDKKIYHVIKLFVKICKKFKDLSLNLTIIGPTPDEIYLNVVMDYIPETVYRVLKHYNKMK